MSPDPDRIVREARGEVDRELLTRTATDGILGVPTKLLGERPLIDYLHPDEQVHYLVRNKHLGPTRLGEASGPSDDHETGAYSVLVAITDRRLLAVEGDEAGDEVTSIPFEEVLFVEWSVDFTFNTLVIYTGGADYFVPLNNDSDPWIEESAEYIERRARELEAAGAEAESEGGSGAAGAGPDSGAREGDTAVYERDAGGDAAADADTAVFPDDVDDAAGDTRIFEGDAVGDDAPDACARCGAALDVDADARFCPACGKKL